LAGISHWPSSVSADCCAPVGRLVVTGGAGDDWLGWLREQDEEITDNETIKIKGSTK